MNIEPLYLDNHLIVYHKPAGMLVQGDRTGDLPLLEVARSYVKQKFNKPGNVFMGLVHRLDRPVSGIVVFARTSKAAARLMEQFKNRTVCKTYLALVEGHAPQRGHLVDHLTRTGATSSIDRTQQGDRAELTFEKIASFKDSSCLRVEPKTGRHHQIRVQLAHFGHPILGDFRYGSKKKFPRRSIALHALSLTLDHPTRDERMTFEAPPGSNWPSHLLPPSGATATMSPRS